LNNYVVFQLSKPLSHFLFQWMSSANYNHNETQYGAPAGYQIQVSSNSTDGTNGQWVTAVNVQNNAWAARAHEIKGTDIRWVRFQVTGGGSSIDEIDMHDLSQSKPGDDVDTWAFIGNSITADTYWRDPQGAPPFNERVNTRQTSRYPSMINFGIGGNTSAMLLARLQQTIDNNQGIHFWAIGIGTNDGDATLYEQNLKNIIEMLIRNGKRPIIARIPYRSDSADLNGVVQSLNVVVDRLTAQYKLPAGPDLYTYFERNPTHLRDGVHPTYTEGVSAIQRLWAEVACGL
jgi:lysophospholipase L1-like esterase